MGQKWKAHKVWTAEELQRAVTGGRARVNTVGDKLLLDGVYFWIHRVAHGRYVLRPVKAALR